MHTPGTRLELVSVFVCLAALLCVAGACGQEAQVEGEMACEIKIEREIDRAVEAMKYLPIPFTRSSLDVLDMAGVGIVSLCARRSSNGRPGISKILAQTTKTLAGSVQTSPC